MCGVCYVSTGRPTSKTNGRLYFIITNIFAIVSQLSDGLRVEFSCKGRYCLL